MKLGAMILREYNLRMLLGNEVVTLQWARKVFEDIYEVSVRYKERGYQTWYMKALATGGFEVMIIFLGRILILPPLISAGKA